MKNFSLSLFNLALLSTCSFYSFAQQNQDDEEIEKIEVRGELLPTTKAKVANSVELLDASDIKKLGAAHIQDVLQQLGNVNYASGSSRARFFQIRGIGERSQFVDPTNPSVGVAIDGIDYSDMANAATLFDIEQVEVFKGPQGTNIGANAMAGFINLTSTRPGDNQDSKVSVTTGNYGYSQLALAHGGNVSKDAQYRVSVNKTDGDGYIENIHLNRSDTNGFDELSLRAAVDVAINSDWQSQVVLHHFDINNGYDTFSLDLNRNTLSDEPGFDTQKTTAVAVDNLFKGHDLADLKVFVAYTDSELGYGYDEDWSFVDIHEDAYSTTDHYLRDRGNFQFDTQFVDKESKWVGGVYAANKQVDLNRIYTGESIFASDYAVTNLALYGEKRFNLGRGIEWSAGLRVENYDADYSDTNSTDVTTDEVMWGGHITGRKDYNKSTMVYFRLSRGFKAGGVNGEALAKLQDDSLLELHGELRQNASFGTESLLNYELSGKFANRDQTFKAQATLFYSGRTDMQIKQWLSTNAENPEFVGFISNAPTGSNTGFEGNLEFLATEELLVFATLALLSTEVNNYSRVETDPTNFQEVEVDIADRDQAHAPTYQFSLGTEWFINSDLSAKIGVTGKDEFYYSYSHDKKSDSVVLLNASINYQISDFDITIWGRNLTDEDYGVRGFFFDNTFGNDPRKGYAPETYEQFGEPAVLGVTLDYSF